MDEIVAVYQNGVLIGHSYYKDVKRHLRHGWDWQSDWHIDDESDPPVETRLYTCPWTLNILPLWLEPVRTK